MDDSYKGITPISLDGVTVGSYMIKIVKEGYNNETREISLGAGEIINQDIQLKPLTGSIYVTSSPSGAIVYLGGATTISGESMWRGWAYKGETPVLLSEVVVGSHTIMLSKSDYFTVTKAVSVSVGETLPVHENLTGYGSLDVFTKPSGASVYLDSDYKGETPLSISEVVEGNHSIKLTKFGHDDIIRAVSVSVGETLPVHENLTGYGSLDVSTKPSGARIYLDDVYKGETPLSISKVVAGDHSIKLTKFGYADVTKMIRVPAGGAESVDEPLSAVWEKYIMIIAALFGIIGVLFGVWMALRERKRS